MSIDRIQNIINTADWLWGYFCGAVETNKMSKHSFDRMLEKIHEIKQEVYALQIEMNDRKE